MLVKLLQHEPEEFLWRVEIKHRIHSRKSTSINDDALITVSLRCKNLTRLKLHACREVTEIGMLGLARNCKNLKKLSVVSCLFGVKGIRGVNDVNEVNEEGVESVCGNGSSSLKSICLKELVNGHSFSQLNWDSMLGTVGKMNYGLVEIHLEKVQVSDVGLVGISKCLKLETLHLVKTPECSDHGLVVIAERCRMLKKHHIDGWEHRGTMVFSRLSEKLEGIWSFRNSFSNSIK